jgi:hypothetical protein
VDTVALEKRKAGIDGRQGKCKDAKEDQLTPPEFAASLWKFMGKAARAAVILDSPAVPACALDLNLPLFG